MLSGALGIDFWEGTLFSQTPVRVKETKFVHCGSLLMGQFVQLCCVILIASAVLCYSEIS